MFDCSCERPYQIPIRKIWHVKEASARPTKESSERGIGLIDSGELAITYTYRSLGRALGSTAYPETGKFRIRDCE